MKKILSLMVIIMALIFTGIQSVNAQISITVNLYPDCPDICTTQEHCYQYIEYAIYEICGETPTKVCGEDLLRECSNTSVPFQCDYECEDATHNPCYFAIARVTKLCIGPGGTNIICNGEDSKYLTCLELLQGVTFNIVWQ